MMEETFTLSEIARRLRTDQHRLIHLCEKEVVRPDLQEASGRGTSRLFSARNVLEFALALRLRDMMLPVSAARAIIYVLRAFESGVRRSEPAFALPESLRKNQALDLRIVLSDGESIYLSLGAAGKKAKLFGGVTLDRLAGEPVHLRGAAKPVRRSGNVAGFGGLEGSRFARLEVSVTQIARDLPLD